MRKLSLGWTAILLLTIFTFTACDDEESPNNPVIGTITDVASADSRFTTLTAALERTGLDEFLDVSSRQLTVFAPTDDAFVDLGVDLSTISDEALANILAYHVILGSNIVSSAIPLGRTELLTENKTGPGGAQLPLFVDNDGTSITINENATVVVADVVTVNGTIHAIDKVLLPPSLLDRAKLDGRFTSLIVALERTGLDETVNGEGTFTIFAPTDDAFTAANINLDDVSDEDLTNLLLYHVLGAAVPAGNLADGDNFVTSLSASGPGGSALSLLVNSSSNGVVVNADADVVVANVFGTNGVIHAVNKVLGPQTIVDFTVKAAGVSELEAAVIAAGLVDALNGTDPLTVFGPVNSAFEAISATVESLTTEQLTSVLTYHVVSGNVRSSDLTVGTVPTLNTNDGIDLRTDDDGNFFVFVNDSTSVNFILTDIQGSNGVIHLIDGVLIPEGL
jgi:transforming growth factor-beta-induced protein